MRTQQSNRSGRPWIGLAAALGSAVTSAAWGAISVNAGFDSDAIGATPATYAPAMATGPAGQTMTKPTTAASDATKNRTTLVQVDYTDAATSAKLGGASGTGNVLVVNHALTSTTGTAWVQFKAHSTDKVSSGVYTIAFDMLVDSSIAARTGKVSVDLKNGENNAAIGAFYFQVNDGLAKLDSYANGGTMTTTTLANRVPLGSVVKMRYVLDWDQHTQEVWAGPTKLGSGTLPTTTGTTTVIPANFGIFTMGGRSDLKGTVVFDNITVAVPEPAALGAMGLSVLGLLRRR